MFSLLPRQTPNLDDVPAYPAPPGVPWSFNDPDNYKEDTIVLHSVVLAFMTVAVIIRLYTRAVIKKNFGLDDCKSRMAAQTYKAIH